MKELNPKIISVLHVKVYFIPILSRNQFYHDYTRKVNNAVLTIGTKGLLIDIIVQRLFTGNVRYLLTLSQWHLIRCLLKPGVL